MIIEQVKRWTHLGLDDAQWAIYHHTPRLREELARGNVELIRAVSIFSAVASLITMLAYGLIYSFTPLSTVPFLLALAVFAITGGCTTSEKLCSNIVSASWIFTLAISATWFAISIFYDTILSPQHSAAFSCIAFVLIPIAFNAKPANNITALVIAYLFFAGFELGLVNPQLVPVDLLNAFIAAAAGIAMGQKRTAADLQRELFADMYNTSAKASLLIAQVNLKGNTIEALHVPDYIRPLQEKRLSATDSIREIAEGFIAPEYREGMLSFFDFDTLPARLEEREAPTFVYENIQGKWRQIALYEQARVDGEVRAFIAVVSDIDFAHRQEMELQEKLREAALEAQRANAAKTSFLRRMSHDVRTPINGIKGILDIADTCPDDMQKQQELRDKAREASNYLTGLVNSILDLNKLESGTIVLENKPFDLVDLLSEADSITSMQAPNYKVEYTVATDASDITHRKLIGSPTHLQQVVLNLSTNALKYNRPGGTLTVSSREISCVDGIATFEFVCADTGIGMSKEFQERAFEPFAQENSGARSTYTGTGLGLSIVKEIVTQMDGTIKLESTEGVGSTFTVTIPFAVDESAGTAETPAETAVSLAGKRVLLVEDNELNREIAVFMLEKEGLEVETAADGEKAVQAFAESDTGHFDVVLMDIMMPRMDGLEAASAIRELDRPDATTVPILAMTAHAFQDDIERSRKAGMNAHLTKPLEAKKIHDALVEALNA